MSLLQRTATTKNNENLNKATKNVVTHIPRPSLRPALDDIVLPNQQIRSSPVQKRGGVTLPSQFYRDKNAAHGFKIAAKPTNGTILSKAQTKKEEEVTAYSTNQIIGITDVDANDKDNPLLVAEYVQDIFKYLRNLESIHRVQDKYLIGHQTTARMRSVLVNWLIDVCINFKFLQETLHLAIGILDRYLQLNKNVGRDILQLVGISALLVAAKYEEIYVPPITDFVYICDEAFTEKEIFKMEIDILGKLKFNLGRPLSLHFLRRYSKIACNEMEHHNLAKYFLEVFLLDYDICSVDPSLQAATACCLSMCVLNDISNPAIAWNKTLEYYSMYRYSDLNPIIVKLVKAFRNMEKSKFQAIKQKYAGKNVGSISNNTKLQTSKVLKDFYEKALPPIKH